MSEGWITVSKTCLKGLLVSAYQQVAKTKMDKQKTVTQRAKEAIRLMTTCATSTWRW